MVKNGELNHSIIPLFWLKGEGQEVILQEMEKMKGVGINAFVVEPRPHPDYLGDGWWKDLDFIISKAEEMQMQVWIFDDGCYPSGYANGLIAKEYPQYKKLFWDESHIDVIGPSDNAHFFINNCLKDGESVFCVLACKRVESGSVIESDTVTDLTDKVCDGRLYWQVPEGDWRIFIIKTVKNGGEEWTKDYVNPLDYDGVKKYTELIHDRHYDRYKRYFGKTVQGFFTDEPRFGNIHGYDKIIGSCKMPLPYVSGLENILSKYPLGDFKKYIPLLWYKDSEEKYHDVRYAYMDTVSRLFAENFVGQLGDWCRAHGVKLVGHLVEENGAHSRLGYGTGHYFRSMKGFDYAGIDVVNNLYPERVSGSYTTMFNEFDCDFNHWGLTKMAVSASHADEKKKGYTLCEAFGAYGWNEGLKTMKWITDHLAVNGLNIITPHAFSMAEFPDPDCPPHFYARGKNPQFEYFDVWSNYTVNLLDYITEAEHVAPIAVVYHAEAEWGGNCEPFEKSVKVLMQNQIDCDVVCIDDLLNSTVSGGLLCVGKENFKALVIPYSQFIVKEFADKLQEFSSGGLPVIFTKDFPDRCYFGEKFNRGKAKCVKTENLADAVEKYADVLCEEKDADLLYTHYRKGGRDFYLFVNQSTKHGIATTVRFNDDRKATVHDVIRDEKYLPEQKTEKQTQINLSIGAWESRVVIFGEEEVGILKKAPENYEELYSFDKGFEIFVKGIDDKDFIKTEFDAVGDLSLPKKLPNFSGTVKYEIPFNLKEVSPLQIKIDKAYESVKIKINGNEVGKFICPPYSANVKKEILNKGDNLLTVEVVNTLVKKYNVNPFDWYFVQEPTGIVSPVRILSKKI